MAFVPWLFEIERSSIRGAFQRGFFVGLIFFVGTIGWIGHVTVLGMLVLAAYLALYFGAWGWFASFVISNEIASGPEGPRNDVWFVLPAAWVVLECARSFLLSGFGWNLLAHTQWNWIPLIQIADITGVWGVSFLVMLGNVAVWQTLRGLAQPNGASSNPGTAIWVALLCVAGALFYGSNVLRWLDARSPVPPGFKVALLQGNISQSQKWDEAFQEVIWKRYEQLTAEAHAQKPDLIVWPETAIPGFLEEPPISARLRGVVQSAGVPMLVGVPTQDFFSGKLFNSAILWDPKAGLVEKYDKLHLVPFGEFVPFKPILGWIENIVTIGDFSPGREFTVFPNRFCVLICFEDLFPWRVRSFRLRGAERLLVITNDGWFGRSAASLQHLQASVFRAVENRVWMGRAANTGWTGFVDPAGRRLPLEEAAPAASAHRLLTPGQAPRFQPAIAAAEIPISAEPISPYVRWGDWFPMLCLLFTGWAIMKRLRRRWKHSIS